jgi:hypothetical protein
MWSLDCTLDALKTLDQISQTNEVFDSFDTITRDKLAFLLRGIFISEVAEFSRRNLAFPLTLTPIANGHIAYAKETKTAYIFFRASKTSHDFALDCMLYKIKCTRGGECFAGPNRIAHRSLSDIREYMEDKDVDRIVLTGASLGASIAAIVADELLETHERISLVSFSSFGVGSKEFAARLSSSLASAYYIRNINDPVAAGFNARIGIPILFDFNAKNAADAHCSLASVISSIGPDEEIGDKSFYFSDE